MNSIKAKLVSIAGRAELYHVVRGAVLRWVQPMQLARWERRGRPVPPPHLAKQIVLREYAGRYGLTILVETGTYLGDMVEAMRNHFEKIYSVELSADLYRVATRRFRKAGNIELIHGDSSSELQNIIKKIDKPALFWLDGHYASGMTVRGESDTPIFEELEQIFAAPDAGHVIIIDDARCFGTLPGYPTLSQMKGFIWARRPDVDIQVLDDSMRITPRQQ